MVPVFIALLGLLCFKGAQAQCPSVEACLATNKTCTVMRIPDASLKPPIPADSFNLTEVRPSVYSYDDGVYISLILYKRETRRLTVLDMPNPRAAVLPSGEYKLNQAIHQVLAGHVPKRLDMVYGHRHLDHIGGAGFVYQNLTRTFPKMSVLVWGTRETRQFLSRFRNTQIPRVRVIVGPRGRTVNLAPSLNLRMKILGGHTQSDLVGLVLSSRDGPGIAHNADFLMPGFVPFLDIGLVSDLRRYVNSLQQLRRMDFTVLSAGHGKLGSKTDIDITIEYVEAAIRAAKEAAREATPEMFAAAGLGRLGDPNAVEFGNSAFAFRATLDVQGDICVRKLIRQFGCRLGGIASYGPSHCKEAFFLDLVDEDVTNM